MKYLLKAHSVFGWESGMVFGWESGMVFGRESGMVVGRESGTVFTENISLSLTVKTWNIKKYPNNYYSSMKLHD